MLAEFDPEKKGAGAWICVRTALGGIIAAVVILQVRTIKEDQKRMSYELVQTADGSLSCRDNLTGELCHNQAGAYTESVHFYTRPSDLLSRIRAEGRIRVLDACYGLGYNTWALLNELLSLENDPGFLADWQQRQKLEGAPKAFVVLVVCIEKYAEILQFLPQILDFPSLGILKEKLTASEHNTYYRTLQCFMDTKGGANCEGEITPQTLILDFPPVWRFELELWVDDLRLRVPQLLATDNDAFDAIFHDPFSPQKMPELWTADLFAEYHRLLQPRAGKLLTYGASAAARGSLIEAGFSIFKTPGLGAKGGGTLALTCPAPTDPDGPALLPLTDWELEYLESRAGLPYRDAGLSLGRAEILANREVEQAHSPRPSGAAALKRKPYTS